MLNLSIQNLRCLAAYSHGKGCSDVRAREVNRTEEVVMWSITKREVRNYCQNPLYWIGIAVIFVMIFPCVSPYLQTHYLTKGETIENNYPDTFRDGDIYEGYVPTTEAERRTLWEEQIREILLAELEMSPAEAKAVIDETQKTDIKTACDHLENYGFFSAYSYYVNTAYRKETPEEINAYIAAKLKEKPFSYYFSKKFADFAGLHMGFFAALLLSALYLQDTRKNTYELLHTKPVRAESYLLGKAGGGFAVCLIALAILNLGYWILCLLMTKEQGFTVRLTDFLIATCLYILPNMLMIVSVYSLISLVFKSPLPAVPLLLLYITYSNMGAYRKDGVYGYYGRPLAIMVRFPGTFFDTTPPPMVWLNQCFLILASVVILLLAVLLWKKRRMS